MNLSKLIRPGSTIGIIGGGQLGRMMAFSAKERGYRIAVLDPTPDCPTAQVADLHIEAAYDDLDALKELARSSDVLTYEFENVDAETIEEAQEAVYSALEAVDTSEYVYRKDIGNRAVMNGK